MLWMRPAADVVARSGVVLSFHEVQRAHTSRRAGAERPSPFSSAQVTPCLRRKMRVESISFGTARSLSGIIAQVLGSRTNDRLACSRLSWQLIVAGPATRPRRANSSRGRGGAPLSAPPTPPPYNPVCQRNKTTYKLSLARHARAKPPRPRLRERLLGVSRAP